MQNMKTVADHLKTHHTKWPATYEELVAECNQLSDFSEADKKEFMEKLPKKTYNSPEEVLSALGGAGDMGGGGAPQGGMPQGGQGGQPGQGGVGGGTGQGQM